MAPQTGVEDVGAGMSVCWFDYDNDGATDLYVADMWTAAGERISMQDIFKEDAPQETRALYHKHAMGNSLFRNVSRNSGGAFEDTTRTARGGNWTSAWSGDLLGFGPYGFFDLCISNSNISGPPPQRKKPQPA